MKKVFAQVISTFIIICVTCGIITSSQSICYPQNINNVTDNTLNTKHNNKSQLKNSISDEDIKQFINDYFTKKMYEYSVPGAQITVVKNGKEIMTSSYGYADINNNIKVDKDNTTFPAASVSKLFTAVAIMQLYEKGALDLDMDANEYISPYKIENKYNKPVTCRNLLTHSSGLDEESEVNTKTEDADKIKSQEYYMEHNKPVVLNEPDSICRYSNQGYNILGFIVEKLSGVTYEEYIKDNILEPLKMNKSSVRLHDENMAKGYLDDDTEVPLSYQYTSGSSGIICNSADMGHFMTAILNDGVYENNRILNEETVEIMKKTQFTNNPVYPGMGFGFIKSNRNNAQILKHEGGLPGYITTLFLLPDENLGIYIATNKMGPLPFNFEEELLNHFYPITDSEFDSLFIKLQSKKDYSDYVGKYRSYDGISKTTFAKIFGMEEDSEIKDNKDGTLTLIEYTNEHTINTTRLVEKEENVFGREDNKGYYTFKSDEQGNIKYAFNDISHNTYEKVNLLETKSVVNTVLFGIMLLFLINILYVIISKVKNRKKHNETFRVTNKLNKLSVSGELLNIIGLLGSIFTASSLMYFNDYYFSIKWLYIALTMILLSAIIFIIEFCILFKILVNKTASRKNIVYYVILNTAHIIMICYLQYFHLIGYNIRSL